MRDDIWLQQLFDNTWDRYFTDVPQANDVKIIFGKRAKRQLGSISKDRNDPSITVITMNGLFRDESIPEFVAESTLVHELIHYAHGFNSPLEQKHIHPHAGGVIREEYAERGLEELYINQKKWLKANWKRVLQDNFGPGSHYATPRKSRRTISIKKPFWM